MSTFSSGCSACVGLINRAIDLLLELLPIPEGVSSCTLMIAFNACQRVELSTQRLLLEPI